MQNSIETLLLKSIKRKHKFEANLNYNFKVHFSSFPLRTNRMWQHSLLMCIVGITAVASLPIKAEGTCKLMLYRVLSEPETLLLSNIVKLKEFSG